MISEKTGKLKDADPAHKMSLLETYLCNPELDYKDVTGMACDMLLAGIDTVSCTDIAAFENLIQADCFQTTYSAAFALYHLARNPEAQKKVHAEAMRLIEREDDHVTAEILKEAAYTKAVIKETFRLNPISIGVGRILQVDVALNGFHVQKGVSSFIIFSIVCTFNCCAASV
jgi:ecdysteroid 25-hydroxylase CYP302A1